MSESPNNGSYPPEFLDWAYREEDLVCEGKGDNTIRPLRPELLERAKAERERRERYREQHRQERARQGLPDDTDEWESTEIDLVVEFKGPSNYTPRPASPEAIERNRAEREHLARLYPIWLQEQAQKQPPEAKNGT
jgi:hypothetical protein